MLTSNSNAYQYYYDTNPYVYSTILESEDSSFKRGVTEHVYAAESYPESSESILGDVIYQLPSNTTTYYHGEELATNYYDSTLKLVKSRFNYYHLDTAVNRSVFGYIVRAKYEWTQPLPTDSIYQPDIDPWDVARYQYVSNWIQLDSTLVVEYDSYGHSSRSKTSNFYGNSVNVLPARIETVDSRNLTVKDERKYPTDSSAVSPYQRMVEKNLISPVIESKISRNNNLVSTTKTNYYDFSESSASGYSVIIKPKTIVYQLGGGPLETRLRFSRYDTKGNGVEMSKENDAKSSYIWDYGRFLPIAEVRNADSASIAFTSFESDGKGNWSFSGVTSTHPSAVTGNRGYSLGGGNITKSGLSTGVTYVVSYWKRDSSSTVTVNGSSGTDAITRNGWKLITHEVTGSSSVAISGTAYIDELRLYPKGSLMTTLTYEPMIGATSQCDPNNRIIYYEYDAFGRLALIRDQDRNVVKKICYNYNGQAGDCISPVPNITVKSTNYSGQSGYVAVYTNTLTLQQYTFPIPATGGLQTLGTVPMGTYNLTISKSGGTWYLGFSAGCGSWVYGTSASFSNLDVNDSSCNLIVIDGI
jgi:YD repeat-containing protein